MAATYVSGKELHGYSITCKVLLSVSRDLPNRNPMSRFFFGRSSVGWDGLADHFIR